MDTTESPTLITQLDGGLDDDQARELYAELIARNGAPHEGDAERMKIVMSRLKLTVDDVRADLEAIDKARRLEAELAERQAEHQARVRESLDARQKLDDYRREAERRIADLEMECVKLGARADGAGRAEAATQTELAKLRNAHPLVLKR